jgi:hypothetical protein
MRKQMIKSRESWRARLWMKWRFLPDWLSYRVFVSCIRLQLNITGRNTGPAEGNDDDLEDFDFPDDSSDVVPHFEEDTIVDEHNIIDPGAFVSCGARDEPDVCVLEKMQKVKFSIFFGT